MIPATVATEVTVSVLGQRATMPCAGCEWASVQIIVQTSSYNSGVLTVKGTIDGTNWASIGEPTISADGIYGPFLVAGLQRVCLEVTTAASTTTQATVTWTSWGTLT